METAQNQLVRSAAPNGLSPSSPPPTYNLAIVEPQGSLTLVQRIRKAQESKPCGESPLTTFAEVWNSIVLILGIKITEKERDNHIILLKALTAYMQEWYADLPIDELLLAYQIGALGKYDIEMYATINPVQIGKVLKRYLEWRRETLTQQKPVEDPERLLAEPNPVPSEQQMNQSSLYLLRVAYERVRQGGRYEDYGNALYNWLDQVGAIRYTDAEKFDFMRQGQRQMKDDYRRQQFVTSGFERSKIIDTHEALEYAIQQDKLYEPLRKEITDKARQLAFTALLNSLIEFDTSVDDYLASLDIELA